MPPPGDDKKRARLPLQPGSSTIVDLEVVIVTSVVVIFLLVTLLAALAFFLAAALLLFLVTIRFTASTVSVGGHGKGHHGHQCDEFLHNVSTRSFFCFVYWVFQLA
jgi:hypothetical protein